MPSQTDDFFDSKDNHPWSRIKDRILGSYMSPYTAKIVTKGYPLLYIDAFAGPGKTQDGEAGSPLIICQAAEKYAKGNYKAIFINNEKRYHDELSGILQHGGYTPHAQAIFGDSLEILQAQHPRLLTESVFLYIDPFGLNVEFNILEPFLSRNRKYSTEIFINLHMPIIHRLAGRNSIESGKFDEELIQQRHDKLTRTLGGDYWKGVLLSNATLDTKEREHLIVEGYMRQLSNTNYLTYTGACPVRAKKESATKYYMIFASSHPDALTILNDNMCKAFNKYMHDEDVKNTMFANYSWEYWRDSSNLEKIIIEYVEKYPKHSRLDLWRRIIKDNFMIFLAKEYRAAVTRLVNTGKIICTTPIGSPKRKTKRLNKDCILEPNDTPKNQPLL